MPYIAEDVISTSARTPPRRASVNNNASVCEGALLRDGMRVLLPARGLKLRRNQRSAGIGLSRHPHPGGVPERPSRTLRAPHRFAAGLVPPESSGPSRRHESRATTSRFVPQPGPSGGRSFRRRTLASSRSNALDATARVSEGPVESET